MARETYAKCQNCGSTDNDGYKYCSQDCAMEANNVEIDPKTLGADGYAMMYGVDA